MGAPAPLVRLGALAGGSGFEDFAVTREVQAMTIQDEMSDLADKIEFAVATEGKVTLFKTDGTRALYAIRKLAELTGQPQSPRTRPAAKQQVGIALSDMRPNRNAGT